MCFDIFLGWPEGRFISSQGILRKIHTTFQKIRINIGIVVSFWIEDVVVHAGVAKH